MGAMNNIDVGAFAMPTLDIRNANDYKECKKNVIRSIMHIWK